MWRSLSHALLWVFYGKRDVSLCAELARRRAACRFCRCVCRALEFVPTFGPGHCDEEFELYQMKTIREPGPETEADRKQIAAWQREWGIQEDGLWGTQSTGQLAIVLDGYERDVAALKRRVQYLAVALMIALVGGAGVLGAM